jgi:hypothetical protein
MESTRCRYVLAAALAASAACVNPLGPDSERTRDPGTLVIRVRDVAGAPIAEVWAYVELPNNVGGFFWEGTPTRADGTATFYYVPAGRRTVEVRPPAGYSVEGPAKENVDMVKGKTVTAQFTLRRN